MISKFIKSFETDNGIVVYNLLYFDPVLLTKDEYKRIIKLETMSESEKKLLYEKHILSRNDSDDYNRLKMIIEADENTSGKIDVIYLILTKACNLRCKYCMVSDGGYDCTIMSFSIAKRTIDLFVEHLANRQIKTGKIVLYGGEPLFDKDLFIKIVEYIKSEYSNLQIEFVTNGTMLNEQFVDFININNVSIGISLDGPRKLNDVNRVYADGRGTYDDIMKAIDILKKKNVKFGLSICISPWLCSEEKSFLEWVDGLPQNTSISINLYHYNEFYSKWNEEYEHMIRFIMKLYDKCIERGIYEDKLRRRIIAINAGEPILSECAAMGENQLTVFPNGKVGVCHIERKNDEKLPYIDKVGALDEIIEHNELKKWKYITSIHSTKCQNCEALFLCGGGCYHQKEILKNEDCDESFCIYAKSLTKWLIEKMVNANS